MTVWVNLLQFPLKIANLKSLYNYYDNHVNGWCHNPWFAAIQELLNRRDHHSFCKIAKFSEKLRFLTS